MLPGWEKFPYDRYARLVMVHASLIRQMYPQCRDSGKIEDENLRIYVMTNVKR
jgi:hypothetical protein